MKDNLVRMTELVSNDTRWGNIVVLSFLRRQI